MPTSKLSPTSPTTPNYGSIPITTTTTTTTSTSSVDSFITFTTHHTTSLLTHHLPWHQFLSLSSFSPPSSYSHASSRIRRNLQIFRYNYSLLILGTLFLSLLWHPISMIVFLLVFILWIFLYFSREQPLFFFGRCIDDRLVLLCLTFITVLALAFTRVGFNVLVSLVVGFSIVWLHAAFWDDDEVYLPDEDINVSNTGVASNVGEGQPLRPSYVRV